MGINYDRKSAFGNVSWILLRIPYCPLKIYIEINLFIFVNIVTKIWLLLINLNGSNRLGDLKFIVLGFIILGFTLAFSKKLIWLA